MSTNANDISFTREFDKRGMLTKVTASQPNAGAPSIDPGEYYVNTYAYGPTGQLNQLTQTGSDAIRKDIGFTYDSAGQLIELNRDSSVTPGNNKEIRTRYGYDLAGRLTSITHGNNALSPTSLWAGDFAAVNSSVLAAFHLEYDSASRLVGFQSSADQLNIRYSYDARGQLVGQQHLTPAGTPHALAGQADQSLHYDANGNRLDSNINDASEVGVANRLLEDADYRYEYDNEGNRTAKISKATDETTRYSWDHRNRLTTVTRHETSDPNARAESRVTQVYDAFNRWVGQEADLNGDGTVDQRRQFVQDGGQITLAFEDGQLTNRYLWSTAVDQLLADERVNGASGGSDLRWALTDHLGSVRALADTNGTVVDTAVYDAFGRVLGGASDAAIDSLFGYTGRPLDEATGLQNNHHRWYDATTSKWLSQDPIGFNAGDANLYRYVGNGPVDASDPSGLKPPSINVNAPPRPIGAGQTHGGIHVTEPDLELSESLIRGTFPGFNVVKSPSVKIIDIVINDSPGSSKFKYPQPFSDNMGVYAGKIYTTCKLGPVRQTVDLFPTTGYGFEVIVKYEGDHNMLRIEQWVSGGLQGTFGGIMRPADDIELKNGYTVKPSGMRKYGLDLSYPGRKIFTYKGDGVLAYYDFPFYPTTLPGPLGGINLQFVVLAYPIDGSCPPVVKHFDIKTKDFQVYSTSINYGSYRPSSKPWYFGGYTPPPQPAVLPWGSYHSSNP